MRATTTTGPTTIPAIAPPERLLPPGFDVCAAEDPDIAVVSVEVSVAPAIAEDDTAFGSSIDTSKHGM